jgi:secondary thiamine-phosphate synthase enzyme
MPSKRQLDGGATMILQVTTTREQQFIEITKDIQMALQEEQVQDGFALVYVPHTTAAVTINEEILMW